MNPNTDVTGDRSPIFTTELFRAPIAPRKKPESANTAIGSAPFGRSVANPADITSYYRTMYDETAAGGRVGGGGGGQRPGGGCVESGDTRDRRRARSGGKGVSCAKREACIRRLCSTVVYDYLLTAVSPSSSPRPLCREISDRRVYLRTEISGVLYLASSRLPARPPLPPSVRPAVSSCTAPRSEVLWQRRVFTSLRSHNSGRQTGKPFFSSLSFSLLRLLLLLLRRRRRRRFPRVLHSSTFLAISVKYFKDRLPPSFRRLARVYDFGVSE